MARSTAPIHAFAHDLRNAIGPIYSAVEILRLRGADECVLAAIDRGLAAAVALLDENVRTEGGARESPPAQPPAMSGSGGAALAADCGASAMESPADADAAKPDRDPMRVLIVDDNELVRCAYRDALVEMGYEVTIAANADQALESMRETRADVALIDIHLPRVNGYELARALRNGPRPTPIRLVMLSGMTLDDEMLKYSRSAGFDDCIDKTAGARAVDELLRAGPVRPSRLGGDLHG